MNCNSYRQLEAILSVRSIKAIRKALYDLLIKYLQCYNILLIKILSANDEVIS